MLSFFVISALAFSAVVHSTDAAHNNTTLLFNKRSNLTYDGAIDYETPAMLVARDFVRRAGWFAKFKQKFRKSKPPRKVVSVPLHRTTEGLFIAPILLGENPHPFHVAIDSGTSLSWAPYRANRVMPLSETIGPYLPRHVGRPGFEKGILYEEEVTFGGIEGIGRIIDAKEFPDDLHNHYDGVLGLALSVHDPKHLSTASPFVTDFLKKYAAPIFALNLDPETPVMHINGTDPEFYIDEIEYHPVTIVDQIKEPQLWQIGGTNIFINGHDAVAGVEIILDTGTWGMSGPPDQVEAVYKLLRGNDPLPQGYDFFPCSHKHDLSLRWNKKPWKMNPETFILGQTDPSESICQGILKKDPHSKNIWTFGGSAMTNWYVAFDATSKIPQAGFAELRKTPVHPPPYSPHD